MSETWLTVGSIQSAARVVLTSVNARNETREMRVDYEPRLKLMRQAAKFLCDLGAHPELPKAGVAMLTAPSS